VVSGLQTVSARLDAAVAAHRLQFDEPQRAAAQRLDALAGDLRTRAPRLGQKLRAVLPWFPGDRAQPPPRGVYLWGGVGRGKTLLMDWFVAAQPGGAERSHFYRFMREVHAALAGIKRHARPLDIVAQRIAARCRLLCLDEFLVADIADAMILAGLLDGLFRRGVALVATSNSRPQDLYADGLQRQRFLPAIELLSALDVIHLGGIDYRLRQLERAPTYLDSNLPGTPAALRERFAEFTGGAASGPVVLTVEGRTLHALNTGPGTAWFEFGELCEGPRSQNDYIELARLYHTVFISNVPVFGTPDEDAARRFIMLLDEFYDRGVKTVLTAAAPPAALYRGERLRFEFERAASRLIEMQTHRYLAGQHRS
jgi:cell division protein ZapE